VSDRVERAQIFASLLESCSFFKVASFRFELNPLAEALLVSFLIGMRGGGKIFNCETE